MSYSFNDEDHVHMLEGSPLYGTSTVVKDVMPPFLAKWGGQCAVDAIKETAEKDSTDALNIFYKVPETMLDKAVNAWTKVRNKAATKGTDMHAVLEEYVKKCIENNGGAPIVLEGENADKNSPLDKFAKWAQENVQQFIFSEKYTYSRKLWVGGIVDCVALMKDGKYAVIDFKSGKAVYFSAVAQCAGYAFQLEESGYGDADGSNWQTLPEPIHKLIVVPFGAPKFEPLVVDNVQGFKDVFAHLVAVYGYLLAFNRRDK